MGLWLARIGAGLVAWMRAKKAALFAALEDPRNDPFWQALHFSAGAYFPALFQAVMPFPHGWIVGVALVDGLWGIPKEFWWDIRFEGASWRNGLRDLSFYLAGSGQTVLTLAMAGRL